MRFVRSEVFQFVVLAVVALLTSDVAYAQDAAASGTNTLLPLGAGLGLAIAAFGGALGQAKIISSALESIARNPGASGQMFIVWILGAAFVESLVILTWLVTSGMAGKI